MGFAMPHSLDPTDERDVRGCADHPQLAILKHHSTGINRIAWPPPGEAESERGIVGHPAVMQRRSSDIKAP